jgi:hypothetical protein
MFTLEHFYLAAKAYDQPSECSSEASLSRNGQIAPHGRFSLPDYRRLQRSQMR